MGSGFGEGLGSWIGSIVGDGEASDEQAQALDYLKQMQKIRMQAASGGRSAVNGMDPSTRGAQMDVLGQLRQVGSQGFQPQDQAAISNTLRQVGTADRGAREGLMNRFESQGMGGSGNELMAQLMSQQGGYDRASQQGTDVAAAGRQRALQAMQAAGSLAGDVRGGDFQAAGANDSMARFNALNQQQANENNANGMRGADQSLAGYYGDAAQRTRKKYTGIGQGIGSLGDAAGGLVGF